MESNNEIEYKEVNVVTHGKIIEDINKEKDIEENKFTIKDEVIYHCPNRINYEAEIFGVKDRRYAIKYYHKKTVHCQLLPPNQKQDLEGAC